MRERKNGSIHFKFCLDQLIEVFVSTMRRPGVQFAQLEPPGMCLSPPWNSNTKPENRALLEDRRVVLRPLEAQSSFANK